MSVGVTKLVRKPSKAERNATKPADYADFHKLVVAASEVVMTNRNSCLSQRGRGEIPDYILVEFPHFAKFREGFPKGHIAQKKGKTHVRKLNAIKLLNWLAENGYSAYNAAEIVKGSSNYAKLENEIEKLLDIKLDK